MTVESQVNKTEAMVMGSSATYDFSFHVLLNDPTENEAKQAIKVSISDGETTTQLEYGTDYTVSLNDDGNGGTVTVADMKTSDYSLIIYREYDFKQGSDYQNYNSFPADTLEGNLDKNVMVAQQLNEKLDRAVLLDMFSTSSPNEYAAKIEALYDIRNEIVTDAQISAAITDVSGNKTNINAVAGNETNINAVAANETNINAVKENETNINTTATNISAVNSAAENMTAIQNAPTQAANAAASATLAEKWAVQMDTPVSGSDYSAKKYALDAQQAVAQAPGFSVDPMFTIRSFPRGVHPSPLSWARCNNTTINGDLFTEAYAALVDGDPVERTVTQAKPLSYSPYMTIDGLDITLLRGAGNTKLPVKAKDLTGLTSLSTDLDNNTLSSFKYSLVFDLDLSNSELYSTWTETVYLYGIGLRLRKYNNQYQFKAISINAIEGTAVSCDIMDGDYQVEVTLRKSGSSFVLEIKVCPPVGFQVSSSYTTYLTNANVKSMMNHTDATYGGRVVYFSYTGPNKLVVKTSATMFVTATWSGTAGMGDNLQNLNETYVDYGYTGQDVYDLKADNIGTVTIPYKEYDGKKFITVANRTLATTVYNKLGSHQYYSVDTTNHNFIVPAKQYSSDLISSGKQYWMLNNDGSIAANYGNNFAFGVDPNNRAITFQIATNESNVTMYFPFPVYVYYVSLSAGSYTYNSANNSITFSDSCTGLIFARVRDDMEKSFIDAYDYCLVGSPQDPIEVNLHEIITSHDLKTVNGQSVVGSGNIDVGDPALLNSNYTSDRILQIMQNLKVIISDGSVVLKAGSKLYDGTGYSWTTTADMTRTLTGTARYFFIIEKNSKNSHFYSVSAMYVQTTQPSSGGCWYNPDTGVTKWSNNATTWADCSLPCAIINVSNGVPTVEIVFNGFGFIKDTLFLLPDMKLQMPNELNSDGTYKSVFLTTTGIKTYTVTSGTGMIGVYVQGPTAGTLFASSELRYDMHRNAFINKTTGEADCCIKIGKVNLDSNHHITAIAQYPVDRFGVSRDFIDGLSYEYYGNDDTVTISSPSQAIIFEEL